MSHSSSLEPILTSFRSALGGERDISTPLDAVLEATDSRAVGLWRLEGDFLVQVGFRAVPEMSAEVRTGFAAATERVALSETGLGIVKAILGDSPAIATLDPTGTGLGASASWLARFGAQQSLAVPTHTAEGVNGVLAMSTGHRLTESCEAYQLIEHVAAALGRLL